MKVYLIKTIGPNFTATEPNTEAMANKMKPGDILHGNFSRMRNPKFHRKGMAMFNLAFQYWQPGEISSEYGIPQKNFDRFRKDLTILAGFFHIDIRLDGSTRIEADSLSFGSMDEDKFSKVYNAVLNVVIEKIITKYSKEEVDGMIDQFVLGFG